ncbi:MAG: GldG family protein [Armatimonadota bacterium]
MAERDERPQFTPDKQPKRSVPPDPRLKAAESVKTSPLTIAGKVAGWVGLVAVVAGMIWTGVARGLTVGPKVVFVIAALAIAFWLATNINAVIQQVRARGFQAVLSSVLFTVLIIGIIGMANYIAGRHHILRADWSEAKLHSLAPGTLQIIKNLDAPVTITAFFGPDYYNSQKLRDLLREYEIQSSKIHVQIYDPMVDLEKVEEYNRPYEGTIFVEAGDRREEVQGGTEEQLSSAILAATTGEKTKVYLLSGHGEQNIEASGEKGASVLKRYLENEQYQVQSLTLATQEDPQVPSDCAVLAIVGAKQPLLDKEKKAISEYVEQGGNLFLALATPPAPDFSFLLEGYGVMPMKGIVVDPARALQGNPQVPVVAQHEGHDIVRDLSMVALPTCIAFEVSSPAPPPASPGAPQPPSGPATAIMESTGRAWLETSSSGAVEKDADEPGGPLTLAVAIDTGQQQEPQLPGQPPPPDSDGSGSRIVAIGDYDFIRDDLYHIGLRSNVFLATSSIAWLTSNEKLVTIPPQEEPDRSMPLVSGQKTLAILISAVIVPVLVLVIGGIIWWRRRGT